MEDHSIVGFVDVRNRQDLSMKVIPLFERYSLHTAMNANGNRRKIAQETILATLKSSETIRQRSVGTMQSNLIKI
jgi:hypothetical protein